MYTQKRRLLVPLNYCESPKKKRRASSPKGYRKRIADIKSKLKVKSEHLSRLKKAIGILNRQVDKKNIDVLSDTELEEYDELVDDNDNVLQNTTDAPHLPTIDDNDCIEVSADNRAIRANAITTGVDVAELLTDRDFSLEYSYTTDVSYIG